MSYGRVLCQVVEAPARQVIETPAHAARHAEWTPEPAHDSADWPRDLLPWADPYIAVLMQRLERQYDWADVAGDSTGGADEGPLASADDSWLYELWQDDAFMPGWQAWRRPMFPPRYGGFPLLDDVTDGLEEDPV